MSNLASFCARYSQQTMQLPGGAEFSYRYYRNPVARATVVLLPGGIGLPDLFYLHFERFAEHYSVITFDYQEQFTTNAELARAVASLLDGLDEHVWLVGQSLGGVSAQIVAKFHPERIEGLVLSNTCSLARDMGQEARDELMSMVENQRTWKRRLQLIPMPVFRRLMAWAVMRKTRDLSAEERRLMQGLCDALQQLLNKQYQRHMWDCSIA
ncbi:MAG: alpha/beta fold hydrolase [Bifidobacterium breve]|nr:alpha/beta fold hydrolase [Bifidobacterium breve]